VGMAGFGFTGLVESGEQDPEGSGVLSV
jgi:hypothetical protein